MLSKLFKNVGQVDDIVDRFWRPSDWTVLSRCWRRSGNGRSDINSLLRSSLVGPPRQCVQILCKQRMDEKTFFFFSFLPDDNIVFFFFLKKWNCNFNKINSTCSCQDNVKPPWCDVQINNWVLYCYRHTQACFVWL